MAFQTSTITVAGYQVTQHASTISSPRGRVVYFDGDWQPFVRSAPTAQLQAMADAANARGLSFYAPRTPFDNHQWWSNDSENIPHAAVARAYVDHTIKASAGSLTYLVGYSGGTVLINKDLAKVGTWPGKLNGAALNIGGGSTTGAISTPAAWRPGFAMHWTVGALDVEGATTNATWSAKDKALAARAEFADAGHPTRYTEVPGTDHRNYDFGGVVAAFLDAVMPHTQAPAPAPTGPSAVTVLTQMPDTNLRIGANADALVRASVATGVPLHIAAAVAAKETRGLNVYGHDADSADGTISIFSTRHRSVYVACEGKTYPQGSNIPVTRQNYEEYLGLVFTADWKVRPGVKPNGVGPLQLTWWTIPRDAERSGKDLSNPQTNIEWGLQIMASYLAGDYTRGNVEAAGTKYNAGPSGYAENGVNQYGRDLWIWSEKYRVALAGATLTIPTDDGNGGTVDVGVVPPSTITDDPSQPPMPAARASLDPGPTIMGSAAEFVPQALPDPGAGPMVVAEKIMVPRARFFFRGRWWSPASGSVGREFALAGPDQAVNGTGVEAATGSIVLARPMVLSDRGWSAWIDSPPRDGEPVLVDITVDDAEHWHRKFTGKVVGSSGSVDEIGVSMSIRDDTGWLSKPVSLPAVGARHPSPLDGGKWMTPGLHPTWVVGSAVRRCGFYATPPMPRSAVVSVPMLGSMWPERGTMTHCQTLVDQGAADTTPADLPVMERTWWGLTPSNVWARYRPHLTGERFASLKNTWGLRLMVGRPRDYPAFVELYWPGDTSIMIQVKKKAIVVETQRGYLSNGYRRVLHSRTRTLTTAQREGRGFQLDIWLHSGGKVEIGIDGDFHVYEDPLIRWPEAMIDADLQEVRVAVRPAATRIGGLIVAVTPDRRQLGEWSRRYRPDVDSWTMLAGTPEVSRKPAIEIIREYAEALLANVWIDKDGLLRDVSRGQMDARPSARTLTLDDVQAPPWRLDRGSVVSTVDVDFTVPTMDHRRTSAGYRSEVWEGPRDTLEPGQTWEQIIRVPDAEDWIVVDRALSELDRSTAGRVNHGRGSWIGGTLVAPPDSDEDVTPGPVPTGWYSTAVWTAGPRQIGLRVVYNPPAGETRHMEMSTAEIPGMWRTFIGRGAILRARAKQTWADGRLPFPVQTGAVLEEVTPYVHPGGRWIQSEYIAAFYADRLAAQFAAPLASWGPLVMGAPDPDLDLGDTITLSMDGISKPQCLCGEDLTFGPGGALKQTFMARQIRA